MKTQTNAYLYFNGNCLEAMKFYHTCLGGELTMQKVSESPLAVKMPSEAGSRILHSSLVRESLVLMGSDMMGSGVKQGIAVALCLNCEREDDMNNFFRRLSSGGRVITPPHQTFWGATYGELTDRYGIRWMLNYSKSEIN